MSDNGGPAFPRLKAMKATTPTYHEAAYVSDGMTLRDYFAAKAMQGLTSDIAGLADHMPGGKHENTLAVMAYELADAMIAERAKQSTER